MKRILRVFLIVIGILLLFLVAAPFLFQDKIRTAIQETIDESVNASISVGDVGLSFFKSFPDARVTVRDYQVIGQGIFAEDTLIQGKSLGLTLDIWSVISGASFELKEIILDQPRIHVIVLEDGTANYDIAVADSNATESVEDSSSFQLAIHHYELKNAYIRYLDESYPMEAIIQGLNHEGTGDINDAVYDLKTLTEAPDVWVKYDGIVYLNHGKVMGTVNTRVDMTDEMHITLEENSVQVNELGLEFDGTVDMPGDDIVMDLTYAAPATNFRGLFSVVPGVYQADFADIQTQGDLQFAGTVKGTYNETDFPAFTLDLKVADGVVQYPDLPENIEDIQLAMAINSPANDMDGMRINIPRLHADLGNNPLDGKVSINRIDRMQIDGNLKGKLNLADITQFYPIEGTELKGLFAIDATAKGVYDEAKETFPKVSALMSLDDGFVKSADYPTTISDLHFHASLEDADQALSSATFDMPDFHFLMDGEPVDGSLKVINFDNPTYDLSLKGILDLAKLIQLYPMEGTELAGNIIVNDFRTQGTYSDIEAEAYTKLPTSGNIGISNFRYMDADMPGPFTIQSGQATFTPDKLSISQTKGAISQSDYVLSGFLSNYVAYALLPDQPLQGELQVKAATLNLNEWMTETTPSAATAAPAEAEELTAFPIPANLDILFQADIDAIQYEELTLSHMNGVLAVRDEKVDMSNLSFGMLGGDFTLKGSYGTQNIRKPTYLIDVIVGKLNISEVLQHFSWIGQFAPALKAVNGTCNTEVALAGYLTQHMHPVLEEIDGAGVFEIIQGQLNSTPMFSAISSKTSITDLIPIDLNDLRGSFKIEDGFLIISPLNFPIKDIKLSLAGKQNLAGAMNYTFQIDAPNGQLSQQAISSLSSLSGVAITTSDRLIVNMTIGGTVSNPTISGAGGGTGAEIKGQVTQAAEDKLNDQLNTDLSLNQDSLKQQARQTSQQAKDSLKAIAQQTQQAVQDSIDQALQQAKSEAKTQAKQAADDALDDLIGEDPQKKLDALKSKLPFSKKKKKN